MHYLLTLRPAENVEGAHIVEYEFEMLKIDHQRAIEVSEKVSNEPFELLNGEFCQMTPLKLAFWIEDENESRLIKRW